MLEPDDKKDDNEKSETQEWWESLTEDERDFHERQSNDNK